MDELLLEHMGKGFILMLVISMPCVLMAAAIGLVVGILQAVTQVQEQTIAAAPKIFAVFLVLMVGGGTFMQMLVNYFQESTHMAFNVVVKEDTFALGPNDTLKAFADDNVGSNGKIDEIMKQAPKDMSSRPAEKISAPVRSKESSPGPSLMESQYINSKR